MVVHNTELSIFDSIMVFLIAETPEFTQENI